MKNLGFIQDPKDLVTKEYVDGYVEANNDPENSVFIVEAKAVKSDLVRSALFTGKTACVNQFVGANARSVDSIGLNVVWNSSTESWTISNNTATGNNRLWLDHMPIPSGHKVFVYGGNSSVLLYADGASDFGTFNEKIITMDAGFDSQGQLYVGMKAENGTTYNTTFHIAVIDLTLIFTSAELTEIGTDVAKLKTAWIKKFGTPLPQYIPYNTGEVVCNDATYQMHGRNLWDEEWEVGGIDPDTGATTADANRIRPKHFIPVIASTDYYFRVPHLTDYQLRFFFYDVNKDYIGSAGWYDASRVFAIPANACYMKFVDAAITTYNNDICINISDANFNGTYEPYFDGGSVECPDLNGIGDKADTYNAITGELKREFASVDLGTLDWSYNSGNQLWATVGITDIKAPASNDNAFVGMAGKYSIIDANTLSSSTPNSMSCNTLGTVRVFNGDAVNAPTGNLVYELATPTTEASTIQPLITQDGYNCIEPVSGDVQSGEVEIEVFTREQFAPTPETRSNNAQVATTAFVKTAIDNAIIEAIAESY